MHYALAPRTFVFSHYFYTGLRIATGIVGLSCLAYAVADLPTAMAVAMGALCTSLMDMPSPLRHKFNEMLAAVLMCSLVALLVSLCSPFPWLLRTVIVLVSFLASMMVVYGRKAMPLQFVALFVMMLSSEEAAAPLQALRHGALFFVGGAGYMAYAMAVVWCLQRRLKQQVLAEALYELASYTNLKANCYDTATALPAQLEKLVRQQSVLAERQQAARDLILRGKPGPGETLLVQVHYAMFDLYELILSTHTDYELLRRHFADGADGADGAVLPLLGDLIGKAARDIESVAYAMTRNRPSRRGVDYRDELRALERILRTLPAGEGEAREALAVLRATSNKIRETIAMIGRLHAAGRSAQGPLPIAPGADLTPFLTQQGYSIGILLANLRWTSPTFRFALRVAMAISAGLLLSEWLPYRSHGYWTALTIAVILKPSFSITRQRRADRLVGTLIGCVLTAVILRFVHAPALLFGFLFVATAAGPTFLYIKYRYTAIAASMQALLLIGLTLPHAAGAISERLLDTLLGTLIATFFSYVLPSWEYQDLPRLVDAVLDANRKYIDAAADLLLGRSVDDFHYRVRRKGFMDSLANLSAALGRMLDEPAAKQRAPEALNRFTVQNYLLVAHVAALRLLLQRYAAHMPRAQVAAALERMFADLRAGLGMAAQTASAPAGERAAPGAPWAGWVPLQRRIALLQQDAARLALDKAAIGAKTRYSAINATMKGFQVKQETAILAGGCFWGMQDLIRKLPGVLATRVGYSGGDVPNATYRNHGTHAEAIEIVFDPDRMSYRRLLEFFFQIHDPSTANRQGNDIGTSYRSAIFTTSDAQRAVALDTIADVDASGLWPGKVVTEVAPAGPFWEAEPEHQDYLEKRPDGYTCHYIRKDWHLPQRAGGAG